jgi:hypothetical protein
MFKKCDGETVVSRLLRRTYNPFVASKQQTILFAIFGRVIRTKLYGVEAEDDDDEGPMCEV